MFAVGAGKPFSCAARVARTRVRPHVPDISDRNGLTLATDVARAYAVPPSLRPLIRRHERPML